MSQGQLMEVPRPWWRVVTMAVAVLLSVMLLSALTAYFGLWEKAF
jgi:hypothetical protein